MLLGTRETEVGQTTGGRIGNHRFLARWALASNRHGSKLIWMPSRSSGMR
jgi:hypothetical protein